MGAVLCACSKGTDNTGSSADTGPPAAPTVTLTAEPDPISEGQSTTLSWFTTNSPTQCTATGDWNGGRPTGGSETITPSGAGAHTYTITCSNAGGSSSATTVVQVNGAQANAPTVSISANPSTITQGQSATLTWSSTNATSCTASGAWSGTQATSGTSTQTPAATGNSTYTLTCTGAGGSASGSATVTVNAQSANPPTVTLAANPSTITQGQSTTLTWSSTNATSCTASGAWSGTQATSGTSTQTPSASGTKTFTLTCTGAGGSASQSATVTVNPAATSGLWSTGYYPAYAESNDMPVSAIPLNSLTHVIHFAMVPAHTAQSGDDADTRGTPGTLTDPFGVQAQASSLVAAAHAAGVKVLLGIGGDRSINAPDGFHDGTANNTVRATLVGNIVNAMASGGYDGVDINWENMVQYGGATPDAAAFHALMQDLRTALDAHSPPTHYLLTFPPDVASDYPDYPSYAQLVLPIANVLDQINLETYGMFYNDYGWVTWYNSPLHNSSCAFPFGGMPPSIEDVINAFQTAGVPMGKIGVGVPFSAVDWHGGSGFPDGGPDGPCEQWTYSTDGSSDPGHPSADFLTAADVVRNYLSHPDVYTRFFDDATRNNAQVPFLSHNENSAALNHFVSYEDDQSIAAKADFIKSQHLGGMMEFEIKQDYLSEAQGADAQHPLMTSIRSHLLH